MSESTRCQSRAAQVSQGASRFAELHPALSSAAAVAEAHRCLYCFNAPCMGACPTHIDVPRFIKKIATDNLESSAKTILEANILGASCARACPVEVLCEGACVLLYEDKQPIMIGRLQRYAMDALHASGAPLPFKAGPESGKRVALIGGGPASLACAAELRQRGIVAEIFDARPLPGGLNTYGIAEYKLPLVESLREIDMLAQLGVIFHFEVEVDAELLREIDKRYDAVFLGIGLGGIHKLGIADEDREGITDALTLIAGYKSGAITSVPQRVAVIGAGNTAIDAAIAAVRLGAEHVAMVYRRGPESMSAFPFEYAHALQEGVCFHWHKAVVAVEGVGHVDGIRLRSLTEGDGACESTLAVDLVVLAIGQASHATFAEGTVRLEAGRVVIERSTGQTSNPRYFAGGDCCNGGREVVDAVADGKRAALGIASMLGVPHAHA